ncbi:MAG: CrcB family protein, partial [Jatrophihabitantaceae bacterium]
LIAGGVAHRHWSAGVQALLGTGFCGGLTTFSTFSVETVELLQGRFTLRSLAYIALSCGLGLAAAALGYALT